MGVWLGVSAQLSSDTPMPLTDVRIRQAKPVDKPLKLLDGSRLYLIVMPSGAKLWRYRYRIDGRENLYAIGEYPTISLQEARMLRDAARALVKQGIHPSHERARTRSDTAASNANTFKAIAHAWIEAHRARWTPYYVKQIESYFERDVYPKIGKRPIRSVTAADIHGIITAIAGRGAEAAAINVRQWCSAVFCHAVAHLCADSDPAAALRRTVIRPPVEHAKPLTEDGITTFFARLATFGGNRTTAIALHLLLLLWIRTAELRKAQWCEFDLDGTLWTIPAGRMKRRRKHLVPLPPQAIALLHELHTITGGGKHLFPNTRRPKDVMGATTVNRALEHMGYPSGEVTGHDFRATASTLLRERGHRSEVIEVQLAHAKKSKTEAAYNHAEYLPERTKMMREWAGWIDEIAAKLVKEANVKRRAAPARVRPSRRAR